MTTKQAYISYPHLRSGFEHTINDERVTPFTYLGVNTTVTDRGELCRWDYLVDDTKRAKNNSETIRGLKSEQEFLESVSKKIDYNSFSAKELDWNEISKMHSPSEILSYMYDVKTDASLRGLPIETVGDLRLYMDWYHLQPDEEKFQLGIPSASSIRGFHALPSVKNDQMPSAQELKIAEKWADRVIDKHGCLPACVKGSVGELSSLWSGENPSKLESDIYAHLDGTSAIGADNLSKAVTQALHLKALVGSTTFKSEPETEAPAVSSGSASDADLAGTAGMDDWVLA